MYRAGHSKKHIKRIVGVQNAELPDKFLESELALD